VDSVQYVCTGYFKVRKKGFLFEPTRPFTQKEQIVGSTDTESIKKRGGFSKF